MTPCHGWRPLQIYLVLFFFSLKRHKKRVFRWQAVSFVYIFFVYIVIDPFNCLGWKFKVYSPHPRKLQQKLKGSYWMSHLCHIVFPMFSPKSLFRKSINSSSNNGNRNTTMKSGWLFHIELHQRGDSDESIKTAVQRSVITNSIYRGISFLYGESDRPVWNINWFVLRGVHKASGKWKDGNQSSTLLGHALSCQQVR